MLHPQYRKTYWLSAGWEHSWIDKGVELAREVYERDYAMLCSDGTTTKELATSNVSHVSLWSWPFHSDALPEDRTLCMDSSKAFAPTTPPSESSVMNSMSFLVQHPSRQATLSAGGLIVPLCILASLGWLLTTSLYPVSWVSITVCNLTSYLCAAATSVGVERAFSQGRFLLPYVRNRLSPESVRALMCLGAWSRAGLVQVDDLLAVARYEDLEGDKEYVMSFDET